MALLLATLPVVGAQGAVELPRGVLRTRGGLYNLSAIGCLHAFVLDVHLYPVRQDSVFARYYVLQDVARSVVDGPVNFAKRGARSILKLVALKGRVWLVGFYKLVPPGGESLLRLVS